VPRSPRRPESAQVRGSAFKAALAASCTIAPRSQYHNTVGEPKIFLGILLDNDRTGAAGAGDGAERPESSSTMIGAAPSVGSSSKQHLWD